jgi:hypothetical protein
LTSRCPEWLKVQDGQFVTRLDRVEIVRRIFRETIEGFGRREIVSRLNGDGILPFKASQNWKTARPSTGWQSSSVAKVVLNRAVIGEYQPHKGTQKARNRKPDGDPIEDYYPRVIDDLTFWRAQKALSDRRQQTGGRRGKTGAHVLRGLVKCGLCGGPMHVVNKGKPPKGGVYLRCDAYKRNLGCDNNRLWRVNRLENAVIQSVGSLDITTFSPLDNATPKAKAHAAALAAEVDALKNARKNLLAIVETGDDAAVARFKEVSENLKVKQRELKAATAEAEKFSSDPGIIAKLTEASSLSNQLQTADENERHDLRIRLSAILRMIVDRVSCHPTSGAVMVLPQRPNWRIKLTGFAVRMEPTAIYVLLDDDIEDEALNHFITNFGGGSG